MTQEPDQAKMDHGLPTLPDWDWLSKKARRAICAMVYPARRADLDRFLRQCCILGEDMPCRPFRISKVDLYSIYAAWAKQSGGYLYESRAFTKALLAKGFILKSSNGVKWIGIISKVKAVRVSHSDDWKLADVEAG